MPYVEVWVDEPEPDRTQSAALQTIVKVCRDIASSGVLPTWDADALDAAVADLIREHPNSDERRPTNYSIDQKYRKWAEGRAAPKVSAA